MWATIIVLITFADLLVMAYARIQDHAEAYNMRLLFMVGAILTIVGLIALAVRSWT